MLPWQTQPRSGWGVWFLLLGSGLLWTSPVAADAPLADRRQAVEQLSPAAKLELQRQKERFESLPLAEQRRMRDLHRMLESHPDSEKLRQVLERYDVWLGTLSSAQRAKLLALPAAERIAQIREMKRRSEESIFGVITSSRLSREDARLVFDWLDELTKDQEEELRKARPASTWLGGSDPRWIPPPLHDVANAAGQRRPQRAAPADPATGRSARAAAVGGCAATVSDARGSRATATTGPAMDPSRLAEPPVAAAGQ